MIEKSPYNSLKEWRKAHPKHYDRAKTLGILVKICDDFGWKYRIHKNSPKDFWNNKVNVLNEIKNFKTKREWMEESRSSYRYAYNNGWIPECEEIIDFNFKKWVDSIYMNL